MKHPREPLPLGDLAAPIAAALAVSFSSAPGWTPAAPETGFLALLVGTVLLPVAALYPPAARTAAGLVTGAAWVLPPGSSRGAAVVAVLVAALGIGILRRLDELDRPLAAMAGALGLQLLLGAETLVAPTPRSLFELLLPAVLAGVAFPLACRRLPRERLLVVAAASIVLTGRIDAGLAAVLILLALRPEQASLSRWIAFGLAIGGLLVWEPRSAMLAAVAALLLGGTAELVAGTALAVVGLFGLPARSASGALAQLPWTAILVPAALWPGRSQFRWAAGLLLTLTAARFLPEGTSPAAAWVVLAGASAERDLAWSLQRRWSGLGLAGAAILVAYPWLRLEPASDLLALLGLSPSWLTALGLLAALTVFSWPAVPPHYARRAFGLALVTSVLVALPRPEVSLVGYEPVELRAAGGAWQTRTPATPTRTVAVGSSASNSLALPRGTPLATVTVHGTRGDFESWTLDAGVDSGEWAARRPDLRERPELYEPLPWVGWTVPGFFGRSYRSLHRLETPLEVVSVQVERHPGLPPDVGFRVEHLDLRP